MSYILIKVVGEEDNCGTKTEFFRVAKKFESLLVNPQEGTSLILEDGEFFIHYISQHLKKKVIYLFEYDWIFYYKYRGSKEDFNKEKEKLEKKGWIDVSGRKYPKRF